jgi:hypothetical protein
MIWQRAVYAVALGLLLVQGADASFVKGNVRGSTLSVDVTAVTTQKKAINWGTMAMGAGIGALVAGAIIGAAAVAMRKKDDDGETDEKGAPLLGEPAAEEEPENKTDYAAMLKALTQRVTDEVGPKFEKGGSVRNILEKRAESFTDKAKNFLLSEMNGTAGAVMREMEAEESMMLLDWNNAVEANFPPASVLMAGVLSPTVINFMAGHHFLQMVTVGLPLFILCAWAIWEDWHQPCSIPTIFAWLYTQTVLAFLLFVGHGLLLAKLNAGRKTIQAKKAEVEENLKGTEEGGFANLQEQFIGNSIILQEALIIENGVRHSIWNTVVGLATVVWLCTTIWNLSLIIGWTFVPGVVAFHPKAAEVAKDEYCGAWATVLVLRISMLLSVLYLFLNLATVVQWFCDMMIESKSFSNVILKQARKADKGGTGLPIVEILAKAFLLRGGDESIISQLAVVQHHKKSLRNKQNTLESQLASLNMKIESATEAEESLKEKSKDGGDLAAQVHKLNSDSVDFDSWKKQGNCAIEEAELKVVEMGQASTDALEKLYEKINQVIEEVENSDTVKAAVQAAHDAEAYAEKKLTEAYDMVNDPEFQAKVREIAAQAQAQVEKLGEQAKDLADSAIAAASDPEFQKQLQEAANSAMAQAKAAAEQAQAAVNDPELQKKLKEAMEMAEAKAHEAAAGITDPELQKKMKETAQKTLEQVQAGAESAAAALVDPEVQKKLQDSALAAMADARAAAEQAAAAATDPKVKEAAMAKLKEAQAAAERAAAVAQDPETRKKFEETAQRAMEQAQAFGEEKAKEAEAAAKKGVEQAKTTATEVSEKASAAAKDVSEKAKGKKGKK